MKKILVALIFIFTTYIYLNSQLLLLSPPVWPDEAEYADAAINILEKGRLYSSIWQDIGNYQKGVFWYPPLLFYNFAFLFKVFGFSIYTIRYTSFILGGIFLILFYIFTQKFVNKSSLFSIVPLLLIILDQSILDKTRIGRPEIYILVFTFSSFLIILRSKKVWSYTIAGLFSGLAIITHYGGIISLLIVILYIFFTHKNKKEALLNMALFGIPILLCIIWWMNIIHFDIQNLFVSLNELNLRKNAPIFLFQLFNSEYFFAALIVWTVFILSIISCVNLIRQKHIKNRVFLIIGTIVTWIYALLMKGDVIYTLPFVYISISVLLHENWIHIKKPYTFFIFNILFLIWLGGLLFIDILPKFVDKYSYESFAKFVTKNIPDNSYVFISSIPDPYFEIRKNKTIRIMHFLSAPGHKEEYINALNTMDFIIISSALDVDIYGNLLNEYIQINGDSAIKIDKKIKGKHIYIIKLKPRKSRLAI
jgi:hypothetical protein